MKKILCLMAVIIGLSSSTILAKSAGYLNVVTGRPNAKIFVDGQFVAKDFVNRYLLESGEHYVRIEYNGKLMYAKMVEIYDGEVNTITSENFVDIKTKGVSRGAMDREVMRLKETKGNFGIGAMVGQRLPVSGMSLKWNAIGPFGLQVSAIGGIKKDSKTYTMAGGRLLFNLGDKILFDQVFSGYLAPGISYEKVDADNDSLSYSAINAGLNLGIEFSLFDPVYFSAEVGTIYHKKSNASQGDLMISGGAGIHIFF